MARKDHLITIQEEEKSSKQSFKRNNAILFQAVEPTIANQINGIGATSKTPDEVKDTRFPVLNPIDPIGKNTDGTINVDLSLENSPFTFIELSDVGATISAITINFLNLVKNKAERFILDITKDPGNVSLPTVTFVPTVENLPAGFPDNDARYLLEVVARETPTETRFEVVNTTGGSGTIPAGTIENQHLEWDNTATDWVAVANSTYGATGPFATTGFLNFANDQIMLSQRNAADSGDLEFKVTTLDAFDFTNNVNSTNVELQIRAQHATNPDAIFSITQNFDAGATNLVIIDFDDSLLFTNDGGDVMQFNKLGGGHIDMSLDVDMQLSNILAVTEIQGRDDATPFKIVFDQAEDADTFISDDTTTADRINVTAGGNTFFSWIAGTPNVFGVPSGETAELEMSNNNIILGTGILQLTDVNTTISENAGDIEYDVDAIKVHSFRVDNAETMRIEGVEVELNLNKVLRFNATSDVVLSVTGTNPFNIFAERGVTMTAQTSGFPMILRIEGDFGGDELVPAQIIFRGDDSGGTKTDYGVIKQRIKDPLDTLERGNLEFEVLFGGGTPVKMMEISGDNTDFGIEFFERVRIDTNQQLVMQGSYIEYLTAISNPGQTGVIRRLFTNSANSEHLSVVTPGGIIDLEAAGGEVFNWTADHSTNGNSFILTNDTTPPAAGVAAIYLETDDMKFNVSVSDFFEFSVNNIVNVKLDTSEAIFSVDVVPNGSRNLGASGNLWGGLFLSTWTLATGQTIRSIGAGPDIIIETNSTNDIIFREGTTQFLRMDGGLNANIFERDIFVDGGKRIRSEDATEIGFFVKNTTVSIGTEGSLSIPFTSSADPTDAAMDGFFGAFDGAIGITGATASIPRMQIRVNSNWSRADFVNSN